MSGRKPVLHMGPFVYDARILRIDVRIVIVVVVVVIAVLAVVASI